MSRSARRALVCVLVVLLSVAWPLRVRGSIGGGRTKHSVAGHTRSLQLLANSGFESGALSPWRPGGAVAPRVTLTTRYGGRYAALLGRLTRGPAATSTLAVSFTIPAHASAVRLQLYAWRHCTGARARSAFTVTATLAGGHGHAVHMLARPLAGCGAGQHWTRVTADLSRARGHTITLTARVGMARGEAAALALDDVTVTAYLPQMAVPRSTETPTTVMTPTAMSTVTATATVTATNTPLAGPTATPTDVTDSCVAPAILAAYQTALPSYTPTSTPRPTATPSATPSVSPTSTPLHSNIPTLVPPSTPTTGPTPGYTSTPGPSPTVGAACHAVVKGIDYGFVSRDGGPSAAATPAVGPIDAYLVGGTGAQHVRMDFHLVHDGSWTAAEYGAYDAAVQAFCSLHIDILGLVGPGVVAPNSDPNSWIANSAERGGGNGDNPFMQEYAARVLDLVGHYHSCIHTWELWNEPNVGHPGMDGTYIYPSNFAAMLADTYMLVKRAYPDVTLVSGGIFSDDEGGYSNPRNAGADYLRQTYDMGLQVAHTWDPVRAAFGTTPLDAVGQHLYLDQGGLVYVQHIVDAYQFLHDAYASFGDGTKPIYVTEAAWSTAVVSPQQQALDLDMLYSTSQSPAVPYVARVYWYLLRDGEDPDQAYGLETHDGLPKPAYTRFQAY